MSGGTEMALDDKTAVLAARIGARAPLTDGRTLDRVLADELAGNELTTLLLHTLRRRAMSRGFVDVLDHAMRTPMFSASTANVRRLHEVDSRTFEAASAFEAVELSPVLPLGATASASVDPNNVLGAVRFAEVAADPAIGLALHAAQQRRNAALRETGRWCTSQRVLRLQPTSVPGFTPHFRLIALLTAMRSGRRGADLDCEHEALLEQLVVWARLAESLTRGGFRVTELRVVLADTKIVRGCLASRGVDADRLARSAQAHQPGSTDAVLQRAGVELPRATDDLVAAVDELGLDEELRDRARRLVANVGAPLAAAHPEVRVVYDLARLQGLGYYAGPFIQLVLRRDDGLEIPLGDGGALPWLGTMLSDRRERMVVTGFGSEACVKLFDDVSGAQSASEPSASEPSASEQSPIDERTP
jgi:Histidyl-tRNA synthetase